MDTEEQKNYQDDKGYSLEELAIHHNIAELMEESQLESLGQRVLKDYDADKLTLKSREEKMDKAMDLALLVPKEKNYPFPKASNVKYPLLTSAAIQFAARSYPAIVTPSGIVKIKKIGNDPDGQKVKIGERVATYENHQLREEMEDWVEGTDKLLHTLPILGCLFKKTYYNSVKGTNVSDLVYPKFLIVKNSVSSLETAPRISHEIELYPFEIIEKKRAGIFLDIDISNSKSSLKEEANTEDEDAAHIFIEQHRLLDLDNDGYPEPYIVFCKIW